MVKPGGLYCLIYVTGKKYIVGYGEGWPSLTSHSAGAEDGRVSAV